MALGPLVLNKTDASACRFEQFYFERFFEAVCVNVELPSISTDPLLNSVYLAVLSMPRDSPAFVVPAGAGCKRERDIQSKV